MIYTACSTLARGFFSIFYKKIRNFVFSAYSYGPILLFSDGNGPRRGGPQFGGPRGPPGPFENSPGGQGPRFGGPGGPDGPFNNGPPFGRDGPFNDNFQGGPPGFRGGRGGFGDRGGFGGRGGFGRGGRGGFRDGPPGPGGNFDWNFNLTFKKCVKN